ncbi:ABC transporter permease [Kibdelosporangium philippinense]|uniref:Transport permease protein n=1 Tax=Kibdelosporangium philippinense TaxID=211113 RepID=A0ABS8Z8Z1_9PSEU|nr:ABC transporter permease [Kibdelosporangium philippinense]MCE7003992.1 ABC transporter permease [Kibdelosporangium philippinense]
MRWALADGWTITRRELIHWVREPGSVLFGLAFTVMIALIFGYLLGGAMTVPGGGNYREFLMPGMFAMNMLFGIGTTMTAIAQDITQGVTDRFRSMPMSPAAVLLGRSFADMIDSVLLLSVLIACGLAMGWQSNGSAGDTALAIALLLMLRFAFIWVGIFAGLMAGNQAMVTAIQTMEFPIGFLSSAFIPPSTMPSWLGAIAEWNPLSSTVAAIRELFANPGIGGDSWVTQNAILMAVIWPLAMIAIFSPLAVRRYRRLSR